MSAAQSLCPAYLYADYIVIQSPQFQKYFNPVIAQEKFLPFGSPKFDSVIHKCQNPPKIPKEWKEKIGGMEGEKKRLLELFELWEFFCLLLITLNLPHPLPDTVLATSVSHITLKLSFTGYCDWDPSWLWHTYSLFSGGLFLPSLPSLTHPLLLTGDVEASKAPHRLFLRKFRNSQWGLVSAWSLQKWS